MTTADRLDDKIYRALCWTLSERKEQVDWAGFSGADWERLPRLAKAEGVAPLMYWTFKEQGWPETMPAGVRASLTEAYYQTAAYNAMLFQELDRILATLETAGIPVIVLKGAALARTIYSDPGLRPMNDIDLMVKPDDLFRSIQAVESLGFQLQKITHHAVLWGCYDQPLSIEIHWSIVPWQETKEFSPEAWFWQEAVLPDGHPTSLKAQVFILSPSANLLYTVSHIAIQHSGDQQRLVWYFDLDQLIRHNGKSIHWEELVLRARDFRWHPVLLQTFRILQEYFETSLPKTLERDAPGIYKASSNTIAENAWIADAFTHLSWPGRLRMVSTVFFPHSDYLRWRYGSKPKWLLPFHYLYRWGAIFRGALLSCFKSRPDTRR